MALIDIETGFWALRRQMEALIGRALTNRVMQQAGANGRESVSSTWLRAPNRVLPRSLLG
jgi:hypothetical protein